MSAAEPLADPRQLAGRALAQAWKSVRERSLAAVDDLDDAAWRVPERGGLNPIAWELGHLAWFAEFWVLRGPHAVDAEGRMHASTPARLAGDDALFDSSRLAHAQRWSVDLPSRERVYRQLADTLDACLAALPAREDDAALYGHRLALFHEAMHAEAFAWTRAALALPAPRGQREPRALGPSRALAVPAARVTIGWPAERPGFFFDNEVTARETALEAFEIDSAPLCAGAFRAFVEDGGYAERSFWPGEASVWRAASGRTHPLRWRRAASPAAGWELLHFDRWQPLDESLPVVHVNAFEAEAYCRWARRRLPSAAEWEHAALRVPRFLWGESVWEWTADAFAPYPGFRPGPYRDYSAPWFGSHRELRGGAFATADCMHDPRFRNFFGPARSDVFAGFRTAALQG